MPTFDTENSAFANPMVFPGGVEIPAQADVAKYDSPSDMETQVIAGYFGSKKLLLFDKRTFNFVKVGTDGFRLQFNIKAQ